MEIFLVLILCYNFSLLSKFFLTFTEKNKFLFR